MNDKPVTSLMLEEARSAGDCVADQLSNDVARYQELGRKLRSTNFNSAVTIARGSSDHACGYLAYLIMSRLGRLVTSLPMSLVTLSKAPLRTEGTLALSISQSGQSPDVVEPIRYFRDRMGAAAASGPRTKRGGHQKFYYQPGGRCAPGGRVAGRR